MLLVLCNASFFSPYNLTSSYIIVAVLISGGLLQNFKPLDHKSCICEIRIDERKKLPRGARSMHFDS